MLKTIKMKAFVSIIMGSTSDLPIMEEAIEFLKEVGIDYECMALSAHRTPELVMEFAKTAKDKGVQVIIAGAGGAAHLPGVVAAYTSVPVIGVLIKFHRCLGFHIVNTTNAGWHTVCYRSSLRC